MAQRGSKRRELTIDEEKDAFLSLINKRIRNNTKKLDQIRELEKKEKDSLKPEQIDKINSRSEVEKNFSYFEGIKDLYYEALKTSKDEGRTDSAEAKKEVVVQEVIKPAPQPEVKQTDSVGETSLRILNLVHFAQLYTDQRKRDELRSFLEKSEVPDFDTFFEFYSKIFTFSESDKFDKVGTKISNANKELESYLNRADNIALRNKSYKYLSDTVEKIASSEHFRDQKADISAGKINPSTQISAIGSELKKETPVEEIRAPEPKTESPVKNIEKEIMTVEQLERQQEAQRQQQQQHQHSHKHEHQHQHKHEHKHEQHHHQQQQQQQPVETTGQKDWADIDEEREETKYEEAPKKQEEDDDGFIEVKKRTPAPTQQRGGQRGGYRGGKKNGGTGRTYNQEEGGRKREGEREGGHRENREGARPHKDDGNREHKPKGNFRGGDKQYVVKNPEKQSQNTGENKDQ